MPGSLSRYINGIAAKRLSAVEAHPERSNQHEFNGVAGLKQILGEDRKTLPARFIYLSDNQDYTAAAEGFVTWYDAREQHPTRSEHRLYFPESPTSDLMAEGDLLLIAQLTDGQLFVIIVESGSTAESQIIWLFGLSGDLQHFAVKDIEKDDDVFLGVSARFILDEIGIAIEETGDDYLEVLLDRYGNAFPTTREFSRFARETLPDLVSLDDPDAALLAWYEREETLFRTLERHIVSERLRKGFNRDVDEFIGFSLSVHNRRKSRAGFALENHVEQVLIDHDLCYSRGKFTEGRAKPDFVFPGIDAYHDSDFAASRLTMLGAKTSSRDRWRQVLPEAALIDEKHLLTLEPGISQGQTDEMQDHRVQLVVPTAIQETYQPPQQQWLLNLKDFLDLIRERQS